MKKFMVFYLVIFFSSFALTQSEFIQENAEKHLKVLAGEIGPRPMGSPAEQRALKYGVEKFKSFGCDTAYLMPMNITSSANTTSGVAVGVKRGITKRIIVIGGHIDSASPEIPGANDDGSGSAVVLELARVLVGKETQSTIIFALFGGEEEGLEGSTYFTTFFPEIDSVVLMVEIDMANGLGIIEMDPHSYGKSAPRWLVRAAIEEYNNLGYKKLTYPTHAYAINSAFGKAAGSDHEPFLDRGIPAIDFTTDISDPIHTPQDNLKNFDPVGLKRSGTLVLKLVERFDNGIPEKKTEKYWMYLIKSTPIFLPLWSLSAFVIISIIITAMAFVFVRRRRLVVTQSLIIDPVTNRPIPNPRGWTGLKMCLFTIIPVVFAWFTSDIIGLLKGIRFPWYTEPMLYWILSVLFGLVGLRISIQIVKKIKLSKCPYMFFKRSVILLLIFVIGVCAINIPLAIYPASALFFVSLAMLFQIQIWRILFLAVSPMILFRLIFNEWFAFIIRTFTGAASAGYITPTAAIVFNLSGIILLSTLLIPFFFALGAVYRESNLLQTLVSKFLAGKTLGMLIMAVCCLSLYLYTQPTYDERFQRSVRVKETFNADKNEFKIGLLSAENLDSIKIKHGNKDTLLLDKVVAASIIPTAKFDTSKCVIVRDVKKRKSNDTTYFDCILKIKSKLSPYEVEITYDGGNNFKNSLSTVWKFYPSKKVYKINWYSYPKMPLIVPLKFFITDSESVKEDVRITYSELFYPILLQRINTNFINRTVVSQTYEYGKNEK
jgi:hypothetical protein